MLPLPETPRWLIEKGHMTEAGNILASLHSKDATPETEEVDLLRRQIETSIEIESAGGPFQYSELLKGGKIQNFRRLVLGAAINLMQQVSAYRPNLRILFPANSDEVDWE